MNWCRIENNIVKELTNKNPHGRFHESLIWIECEDNVDCDWVYENGVFDKPKINIETIYNSILNSIKSKSKSLIIDQYPEWKQLNMTNDTEISKQSIIQLEELGGYDILTDDVMKNVTMKIGFNYTYETLKTIEDDYINLDVSDLTLVTDEDLRIKIELYYKKIILAYVVYRRIEIIRDTSNIMENEVKSIYNNTSLSDEDKLTQLENYSIIFDGIE